eukprot:TRINITY_DN5323_c0_g1_i1.p1 TRINITY_DN5323_c0_g1~~TRINITY_DN5323_c0_g1_i1.p1  ORF type:complete len:235 (-),score=20.41 TRINITY_DN5323_c0_g1_i1:145-849(-)
MDPNVSNTSDADGNDMMFRGLDRPARLADMESEHARRDVMSVPSNDAEVFRVGQRPRSSLHSSVVSSDRSGLQLMERTDEDVRFDIPMPFGLVSMPTSRMSSSTYALRDQAQGGATTLVVRNVPFEITPLQFRRNVDLSGFEGQYDILFMPVCSSTRRNKGFGFINFLSVGIADSFAQAWHQSWEFNGVFHSPGPVIISPAQVQGRDANLRVLKRNKLLRLRDPELKPFVKELK